jgi:hypothetical protein
MQEDKVSEPRVSAANMMRSEPGLRLRLLAFGLTVTVLIALVVLASQSSSIPSGEERANAGPVIAIVHLIEILGIAVELLALFLLLVFFRPARRRRREDDEDQIYHEPVRVHWAVKLLLAVFPLLVLGGLIFALSRFHPLDQPPEPPPIELAPPVSGGGGLVEQVSLSLGLGWWEVLIATALAGLALVVIVRALRAPRPTPRDEPVLGRHAGALATAISAGLHDARLEPDPRRAVIAAYATMEQILAAQGLPRRTVEAPLEYMTRLFAELDVSDDALRTLTELFELARFSHHVIVPAVKARALAALTQIEQELQATR